MAWKHPTGLWRRHDIVSVVRSRAAHAQKTQLNTLSRATLWHVTPEPVPRADEYQTLETASAPGIHQAAHWRFRDSGIRYSPAVGTGSDGSARPRNRFLEYLSLRFLPTTTVYLDFEDYDNVLFIFIYCLCILQPHTLKGSALELVS
ncbi:hypothetical protein E2C01_083732 [Portunus trituberculatus]|uniref:Uncharacterized protein n=1 Tax=Portunus trituberculatus TaxID=210409 RepID=A0A5B7IT80_PORTR|nr:hypothetical protein [Portunus trituberculatus]